ncbi:shikimate dehydrogenase family protein [Ornithinimicrobium pratense]|uniref:Shikimate dehydrogenase n=1 Tax=Ornithinimicrobium pratense TaxID=2593973 RepID=A0A5J6V7L3_9MICO|nr:shikimate dehydrogenase [Ornithinimicrobium pratense]QFG69748.1 shikimate dehydrogenase [Ornithinimicrobium pratense]
MATTYTHDTLQPATKPTFYFVGVTTGKSSIRRVFPAWAQELGLGDIEMVGIDLAVHAPRDHYRRVVEFLKQDPLSLGGLVTTHKIDLYREAGDLFDSVDPLAELMGEVSCLAKRDGRLEASAKDPFSSGHSLDAFIPDGHFASTGAELFIMGAGGSAIAIDWYLGQSGRGADRPSRTVVSNRSTPRLTRFQEVHEQAGNEVPLDIVHTPNPADNDAVLKTLSPGAVVINATGLGKDAPGSPLTDAAVFPDGALVWDLNYRGDLIFLDQARAQETERSLHVEDGWVYFIHGWTQVISEVFQIDIPTSGPAFDRLAEIAGAAR